METERHGRNIGDSEMILIIFGIYLILDAVINMAVFREQPAHCQMVRIGRLIIGIALIVG